MITVGLDMSLTGTGFCILTDDKCEIKTIKTKPADFKNILVRLQFITDEVFKSLPSLPDVIIIEDYFTPQNKAQIGAALNLVALGTLIRIRLYQAGLKFIVVNNQQVKKWITGKGNAQKSMIIKEVYKKLNIDAKDDNQADACVMAHIGRGLLNWMQGNISDAKQYEIDVYNKISEKKETHFNL